MVKIKSILDNIGLSYLWDFDLSLVNFSWLKNTLEQKLNDIFLQSWSEDVNKNGHCVNYRIFKTSLHIENYLIALNQQDRISLCKFRCGNNKLPINTGRYQCVARHERVCTLCKNHQLGDEFHYLLECPSMADERKKYLAPHFSSRPNIHKMQALMDTQKYSEISNLAKFCRCIMKKFR